MKKFLTIPFILFAGILLAQSGTTLDEYRYLSKGYAYQLEMGLDPSKKGYEIRQNYTTKNQTNILGLYQLSDQLLKGLLLESTDEKGKSHFWVIPNLHSEPNVLTLYRQDLQQHQQTPMLTKMLEAKDEYLFYVASNQSAPKNTNPTPVHSSEVSAAATLPSSPPAPATYDAAPVTREREFTAKGGASISTTKTAPGLTGSTITGTLSAGMKTRTLLVKPFTRNATPARGKVMIKFCTNPEGVVTYAKFTQRGSTTLDSQLKALALAAVRKMRLSPSDSEEDCGTVGFDF